jgi:hypothetical protein
MPAFHRHGNTTFYPSKSITDSLFGMGWDEEYLNKEEYRISVEVVELSVVNFVNG